MLKYFVVLLKKRGERTQSHDLRVRSFYLKGDLGDNKTVSRK